MPRPALLPALVLLLGVAAAGAQVPAGPEFRVNASTLGTQETPDVVFQPDGGFIIVWGDADGFGFGIRGQAYDPAGAPRGASFQVNTYTTNQQRFYGGARSVAPTPAGVSSSRGPATGWTAATRACSRGASTRTGPRSVPSSS